MVSTRADFESLKRVDHSLRSRLDILFQEITGGTGKKNSRLKRPKLNAFKQLGSPSNGEKLKQLAISDEHIQGLTLSQLENLLEDSKFNYLKSQGNYDFFYFSFKFNSTC